MDQVHCNTLGLFIVRLRYRALIGPLPIIVSEISGLVNIFSVRHVTHLEVVQILLTLVDNAFVLISLLEIIWFVLEDLELAVIKNFKKYNLIKRMSFIY